MCLIRFPCIYQYTFVFKNIGIQDLRQQNPYMFGADIVLQLNWYYQIAQK